MVQARRRVHTYNEKEKIQTNRDEVTKRSVSLSENLLTNRLDRKTKM